jgi:hypothetical protein
MTSLEGASRFVRLEDPMDPLEGIGFLLISRSAEEVQESRGPLGVEAFRIRLEDRRGERCDLRTSAKTSETERCMILWLEGNSCWNQLETMV